MKLSIVVGLTIAVTKNGDGETASGLLAQELVTWIGPVDAPAGTEVSIVVSLSRVPPAGVPLNSTLAASTNLLPLRVTGVQGGPVWGVKLEIDIGAIAKLSEFRDRLSTIRMKYQVPEGKQPNACSDVGILIDLV